MKTWMVSGASSGIGYETTRQLLERGERVVACARRIERLETLRQQHGERLRVLHLEMTNSEAIEQVVQEAFKSEGRIDVLLSSAGYGLFGAVEELDRDQIEHQLQTNLLGSILLIRAVLPFLRAQGGGRILQMSSESGEISFPALSLYQASKWGIEGFCEGLRQEVASFGIDVVLVVPGRVPTRFDEHAVTQRRIIADYQRTTVGNYRRLLAMGKFANPGSAEKMAEAIIAVSITEPPPRRLILGSDAYKNIRKALDGRLAELERQRESAAMTDR